MPHDHAYDNPIARYQDEYYAMPDYIRGKYPNFSDTELDLIAEDYNEHAAKWHSVRSAGDFRRQSRAWIDDHAGFVKRQKSDPRKHARLLLAQQQRGYWLSDRDRVGHWDWHPSGDADRYVNPEPAQEITFQKALSLLRDRNRARGVKFEYPIERQGKITFVDLNSLRNGAVLKIDTAFLPLLKTLVPFKFDHGKLYTKTDDGKHQMLHHVAFWFDRGYVAENIEFINGDTLDLTGHNLHHHGTEGKGTIPDEGGETRQHADSYDRVWHPSGRIEWATRNLLPTKPVRPKGHGPDEGMEWNESAIYMSKWPRSRQPEGED